MKQNLGLAGRAPRVARAKELVRAHPLLARARSQLGQAVDEILASSLEALGERLGAHEWLADHVGARAPHAARLREIVERDRALVAADWSEPNRPTAPNAPISAPPQDDAPKGQEPIRTRTMARLLAGQGYRERALSIYDALLALEDDRDLRAEADALRAQVA